MAQDARDASTAPAPAPTPACPRCGRPDAVAIRYGIPSAKEAPGVLLGGCSISDVSPRWACPGCGHRWGRVGPGHDLTELDDDLVDDGDLR